MKRLLYLFALASALAACGTSEIPATSRPTAESAAGSAALVARPTVTLPPPTPTRTPLPTAEPTSIPLPTAEPTATPGAPATAAPTQAPLLVAGVDSATWVTYQNEQYGFSLRYPPCLGEIFADAPYSRPAGLYRDGYSRRTARMITTTLDLSSGPVSPDCVAQSMDISVWDLAGYSHYNIYSELTYDPASDSWFDNRGDGPVPDDSELVDGDGWRGQRLGFGDAEFVSTGLAVPWEERGLVLEVSFSYIYSQDGPPSQGMNRAAIDQILQSLRLTP